MSNKSQTQLVREHLEAGYPLTPAKALAEYGIWRLAAVIYKLRERGYGIETKDCKSLSGKPYAEYELVAKPAEKGGVGAVFGLGKPEDTTMVTDESVKQEDVFEEGDVVKVVGNDPENPVSTHCFPVPSIGKVIQVLSTSAKVQVQGVQSNDNTVPQIVLTSDLEKVTDYSGLKAEALKNGPCLVCGRYGGQTFTIKNMLSLGEAETNDINSPGGIICPGNYRILPQEVPKDRNVIEEPLQILSERHVGKKAKVVNASGTKFAVGDVVRIMNIHDKLFYRCYSYSDSQVVSPYQLVLID